MTALVDLLAQHQVVDLLELQGDRRLFLALGRQLLAAATVSSKVAVVIIAVVLLRLGHRHRHLGR